MVLIDNIHSNLLIALSIFSVFSNNFTPSEIPWYDFLNHYQVISTDSTTTIDLLLMNRNHSRLGLTSVEQGNRVIPSLGYHYYYLETSNNRTSLSTWTRYITLIKKEKDLKNNYKQSQNTYYYIIRFNSMNTNDAELFKKKIFSDQQDFVKAIHIDTSNYEARETLVSRSCGVPMTHQIKAIDYIINHWRQPDNKHSNTKIILSGHSGVGKTYTGELLKKYLENHETNIGQDISVQLFIDFNPSIPGLDIYTLALSKARPESPVIIIMNEIDQIYHQVFQTNNRFESRSSHTDSKVSFNNMLDAISRTPYVIAVFTTEKSPEYLKSFNGSNSSHDYRAFFRLGRVDFFLQMSKNKTTRVDTITLK